MLHGVPIHSLPTCMPLKVMSEGEASPVARLVAAETAQSSGTSIIVAAPKSATFIWALALRDERRRFASLISRWHTPWECR